MLRHPLERGIAFLKLSRKLRGRQRSVFDEHADLAGADNEISQQTLMVLKVADDPDAAMDEQKHAGLFAYLRGLHDVQLNGATILGDGPVPNRDAGHIYARLRLQRGEGFLRLGLG